MSKEQLLMKVYEAYKQGSKVYLTKEGLERLQGVKGNTARV